MRRPIVITLLVILHFILQTTIFHYFEIRGILPNTTVILIVSYSLLRGKNEALAVGLLCGLLQDIFFGYGFGFYTALDLVLALIISLGQKNFYRENYLFPMIVCVLATICYETVIFFFGLLTQGQMNLPAYLWNLLLPECVYTAVATIPLYRLLFAVNDWLELKEKYKYRLF